MAEMMPNFLHDSKINVLLEKINFKRAANGGRGTITAFFKGAVGPRRPKRPRKAAPELQGLRRNLYRLLPVSRNLEDRTFQVARDTPDLMHVKERKGSV